MAAKYSLEEVRDFWTNQAEEHGQSPAASWSDVSAIQLEIREILNGSRMTNGFSMSAVQMAIRRFILPARGRSIFADWTIFRR